MRLDLARLRLSLGQFGLNPLDWCVEVRAKYGGVLCLEITSLRGEPLCFEGWAEHGEWISVSLAAA